MRHNVAGLRSFMGEVCCDDGAGVAAAGAVGRGIGWGTGAAEKGDNWFPALNAAINICRESPGCDIFDEIFEVLKQIRKLTFR